MSGSTEPQVALVSVDDQGTIMALIDIDKDNVGNEQLREAFVQTQEVLMRVAQYPQPIREVQMVCEHPQQIIDLQRQITDLQTKQFLLPQCDDTELEQQIQTLRYERDEALRRPAAPGTDEDLRHELGDMTRDARQSGEEVCRLRMSLEDALMLAAIAARLLPRLRKTEARNFLTPRTFQGRIELNWEAGLLNTGRSYDTSPPAVQTNSRRCGTHSTAWGE